MGQHLLSCKETLGSSKEFFDTSTTYSGQFIHKGALNVLHTGNQELSNDKEAQNALIV